MQCRERSKRCVVPALRLLKFSVQSFAAARPLHFTCKYNMYDTRRLPYVGDPCKVDNGFDQPSRCGLGVGKAALRGTRLS